MFLSQPIFLETVLGDILLPGPQLDLLIALIQLLQTVLWTGLLTVTACVVFGLLIKLRKED